MIEYIEDCANVDSDQLGGFFEGWPNPPTPETHLRMLRSSSSLVLAVAQDGQVVGFVTAISDGVLSAYVPFLEVLPAYRRRGIGHELVSRLLAQLSGLYLIDLHCDPELETFYEEFGMRPTCGMGIRNYAAQSGRHAV